MLYCLILYNSRSVVGALQAYGCSNNKIWLCYTVDLFHRLGSDAVKPKVMTKEESSEEDEEEELTEEEKGEVVVKCVFVYF